VRVAARALELGDQDQQGSEPVLVHRAGEQFLDLGQGQPSEALHYLTDVGQAHPEEDIPFAVLAAVALVLTRGLQAEPSE